MRVDELRRKQPPATVADVVVGSTWVYRDSKYQEIDHALTVELIDGPNVICLIEGTGKTRMVTPAQLVESYELGGLEHTTALWETRPEWFVGKLIPALVGIIAGLVFLIIASAIISNI